MSATGDLFTTTALKDRPLAERMRPNSIDTYIGQSHLMAEGKPLRRMLQNGQVSSLLFWGPPGVGKTTLALLFAKQLALPFYTLSAINSGVKEVREVIQKAQINGKAILFIDEIHRFNKSQQDSLLGAVEKGTITLIGATTENPSFEVISPLLSRCQVYILKNFSEQELLQLMQQALQQDELLKNYSIELKETAALLKFCGGDARKLLNTLELVINNCDTSQTVVITDEVVMQIIQQKLALYDKNGEQHYDIISAFIKSIRGSDPNAALYYLARMIEGGEDPSFTARRLLILASEDIGNANPTALVLANSCFQAVNVIGYPECRIILSQCVVYLATSAKSNATYMAIEKALAVVRDTGDLPVPLDLRNAPTKFMKNLDYGKNYQYAHSFEGNFVQAEFMPEAVKGTTLYEPGNNPRENEARAYLLRCWKEKYGY